MDFLKSFKSNTSALLLLKIMDSECVDSKNLTFYGLVL
jgi:hypothetical protein